MTKQKGGFLEITAVLALLVATTGLGRATPDLTDRSKTEASAPIGFAQASEPSAAATDDWPPRITQDAAPKFTSQATPVEPRIQTSALEPTTDTQTDAVEEPQTERQSYRPSYRHHTRDRQVRYTEPDDLYRPRLRRLSRPHFRVFGFSFRRRWF